ncbi:hypothetical protein LIER_19994 [Lithospermum erythrorhizon]|uniref:MULE transposase domain-containing protein n=1 Tax=Lithospermum erythrorhizon TaxID=34254 RepID=A0AAV3QMV1_LITER
MVAIFKTKRGGQLLVALGIDPNNNIFPIAYALVEIENKASWEWFLHHLYEDIMVIGSNNDEADKGDWTFMCDKQKGLIEAFKIVLLRVDHRFCVHENFKSAGFRAQTFKDVLWTTATSTTTQWFQEAMDNMKALVVSAFNWLEDKDPKQWSRTYFTTSIKCDVLPNNRCEIFNSFILDARDKPILTFVSMVKDLIMCIKEASSCMPMKSDRKHFQLTGIPYKCACASIRLNGEDVIDYVDECYYVETYKRMYAHAIFPMAGPELWPVTVRKYLCKTYKEQGHNNRVCKKKNTPVEQPPNVSQESIQDPYLSGSQTSRPARSQTSTQSSVPATRTSRPSGIRLRKINPPKSLSMSKPRGISIRAPPPIMGNMMNQRVSFIPPTRFVPRTGAIFVDEGKKFVKMKDLKK